MFTYKIYNNIAQEGIEQLESQGFKAEKSNPDAILIRSHILTEIDLNQSL